MKLSYGVVFSIVSLLRVVNCTRNLESLESRRSISGQYNTLLPFREGIPVVIVLLLELSAGITVVLNDKAVIYRDKYIYRQ